MNTATAACVKMLGFKVVVLATIIMGVALLPASAVAQTSHVVGGNMGWVIPLGDAGAYATWASTRAFAVGDKLVFNYAAGQHDVAHSSKAAYDACNASLPIISTTMAAPATITLTAAGENYFFCTIGRHCALGQKLAINVSSASASSPSPSPTAAPAPETGAGSPTQVPVAAPTPALPRKVGAPVPSADSPSPVTAPAPSTDRAPMSYIVGDSMGWTVPPGGEAAYTTWASDKTFSVGDVLVFNFTTGRHDVAEVTKTEYGSCSSSNPISKQTTGPARITLTAPGEHFYICTFNGHCSLGQKLAINVTGAGSPAPTSGALPPSTPNLNSPSPAGSTPSENPGNFASSTSVSGLSVAILSIIVAYMI
uniref:Phytocyanin domain-containing protein n=1 Tax=Kalanchoe fedtschenkoi TaxID=63787 RepID=A0A7N0UIF8_KALFE